MKDYSWIITFVQKTIIILTFVWKTMVGWTKLFVQKTIIRLQHLYERL